MASAEIALSQLIEQLTLGVIYKKNYEGLRQLLLERQALPEVVQDALQYFTALTEKELKEKVDVIEREVCQAQIQYDNEEEERDAGEAAQDTVLQSEYQTEFTQLEQELATITSNCLRQQIEANKLGGRQERLEHRLTIAQYDLRKIESDKEKNAQVSDNNAQADQERLYPQLDRINLEDEPQIIARIAALPLEIEQATRQYDAAKQQLDAMLQEQESKKARHKVLQEQLQVHLAGKMQARATRSQERAQRASARNAEDPLLNQLSKQSLEALRQGRQAAENELMESQRKDMEAISQQSYPEFLKFLEIAISTLRLPEGERGALAFIIGDMKEYMALEATEQELQSQLKEPTQKRSKLQDDLRTFEQQLNASNTDSLLKEKAALIQNESSLKENLAFLQEYKDWFHAASLTVGSITGFAYLLTALITDTLILAPLLWIIPLIPATFTVVFVICALTYYGDQCTAEERIVANDLSIRTLSKTINQQDSKACELNDKIIPDLKTQLAELDKIISPIEARLEDQRKLMANKLLEAKRVGSAYTPYDPTYSFFPKTAGADTNSPEPSIDIEPPKNTDATDEYEPDPPPYGAAPGGAAFG